MSNRLLLPPIDAATLIARWRRRLVLSAATLVGGCSVAGTNVVRVEAPSYVSSPTSSLAEAPFLTGATYFALFTGVDARASFGGMRGPSIVMEREGFDCAAYLQNNHDQSDNGGEPGSDTCPSDVADALRPLEHEYEHMMIIVDEQGTHLYRDAASLQPIDSPAKAAAAVWLNEQRLEFPRAPGDWAGGLAAAEVRTANVGYEVTVGVSEEESLPSNDMDERARRLDYRATLWVHPNGVIEEAGRVLVQETEYVVQPQMPMGRRPQNFCNPRTDGSLRAILARAMHHEAESVRAFERLARELSAFGAPRALVDAALQAAVDERRHATQFQELAAHFGIEMTPTISNDELPIRSLEEVAIENVVEGCTLESYAALMALHQSVHALDERVRAHYAQIAEDELDHAALALACNAFFESRLDTAGQTRVLLARERASRGLALSFSDPSTDEALLGLPTRAQSQGLFAALMAV